MTDRLALSAAATTLLMLGACGDADDAPAPVETAEAAPQPASAPTPQQTPFNAQLPGPQTEDPKALLSYWKQAVEEDERGAARRAWRSDVRGGGTAPRWSNLSDITVRFGEGQLEGAAGSSYYNVPVTLEGTSVDATAKTLEGTMTLRRANNVPGADAEQLSWRIDSIDWNG